jgi:hypothetical protein
MFHSYAMLEITICNQIFVEYQHLLSTKLSKSRILKNPLILSFKKKFFGRYQHLVEKYLHTDNKALALVSSLRLPMALSTI